MIRYKRQKFDAFSFFILICATFMYITWLGYSCFKIQERDATIIIDPYDQRIHSHPPIIKKASVVLLTDTNLIDAKKFKESRVLSCPGEYEVQNIFMQGLEAKNNRTIFFMDIDGISIAHLGNVNSDLTAEQKECIEDVDILMIPVGGNAGYDYKKASQIIATIEPRIVLPMSYHVPGSKIKLDSVEPFLKEMGVKDLASIEKLKISKKDLPSGETNFYILSKQ